MSSQYKLKRCLAGILAAVIAVSAFSGCSGSSDSRRDDTEEYETEDRNNERVEDKENDSLSGGIFGNNDTPSHVELGSGAGEYLPVDTPPEEVIDEYVYPDIWEVLPYIDETSVSKFKYEYDADLGGMAITDYTGASPKVRIPDKIEGEPVVSADLGDAEITHLVMPTTLVELKCNRWHVKYVNYPNNELLYFSGDFDRRETIYDPHDFGCAFTELEEVYIEPTVTEISEGAFKGCTKLTTIVIPNSVRKINKGNIFQKYDNPDLVTISVNERTDGAFSGCTMLNQILYKGKYYSYNNIEALYDAINYPDGCVIQDGVLKYCPAYYEEELVIPNSATQINVRTFQRCADVTSIVIPDSVTKITGEVYEEYFDDITFTYKGKTYHAYESIDNIYDIINNPAKYSASEYIIENGVLIYCSTSYSGKFIIPDNVTRIENSAFSGCTDLTTITIPDSVTEIGYHAFEGCTSLTSIAIPDSVTVIDDDAFYGCTNLNHAVYEGEKYSYENIDDIYMHYYHVADLPIAPSTTAPSTTYRDPIDN